MAAVQYNTIFNYLKSCNFHYLESWVIECVDYYRSSNPSLSESALKEEVRQQWLLLNLRDMKVGAFPPNLKSKDKIILSGKYAVQVETLLDSGQSRYSQLQDIRKEYRDNVKATTNPQDEMTVRRCYTMTITDGVQDLSAMEYELIPALRLNDPDLLPGFKMVISGPVTCRKGMVMLSPKNVLVCGGEVDVLAEENRLEALLLSTLGMDSSAAPVRDPPSRQNLQAIGTGTTASSNNLLADDEDDDFLLSVLPMEVNDSHQTGNAHNSTRQNNSLQARSYRDNLTVDESPVVAVPRPAPQPSVDELMGGADDIFLDLSEDRFGMAEESALQPQLTPLLASAFDTGNITGNNGSSASQLKMDKPRQPPSSSAKNRSRKVLPDPKQTSISQYLAPTAISADRGEPMEIVPEVAHPLPKRTVKAEPFVYLAQVLNANLEQDKIFKVKAVILTLKTKIAVKGDSFTLQAKICDGSLSMDVQFSSDVLENLLNFSPSEMVVMVRQKSKNAAVGERLKSAFVGAQQKLISLNCILGIQFSKEALPCILYIEEVTSQDLRALKTRLVI